MVWGDNMKNPYKNVNWESDDKIMSISHVHEINVLSDLYNKGVRHLPYSPYYPSDPNRHYPLSEKVANIPTDLMSSPNAEHTNTTNGYGEHIIGLGSFFESGKPSGESPIGLNDTWQNGFKGILENLQYEDGGGVIIAHPNTLFVKERHLPTLLNYLDYDSRVLGIEVYNHSGMRYPTIYKDIPNGIATHIWDDVLRTGRHKFGYCVIDHAGFDIEGWGLDLGRNMLLVPEATEHECLKAYRNGNFYGALSGNVIHFTTIQANETTVTATVDLPSTLKIITNDGVVKEVVDESINYDVKDSDVFVRIEAYKDREILYSQPIMYKTKDDVDKEMLRKKRIRNMVIFN